MGEGGGGWGRVVEGVRGEGRNTRGSQRGVGRRLGNLCAYLRHARLHPTRIGGRPLQLKDPLEGNGQVLQQSVFLEHAAEVSRAVGVDGEHLHDAVDPHVHHELNFVGEHRLGGGVETEGSAGGDLLGGGDGSVGW